MASHFLSHAVLLLLVHTVAQGKDNQRDIDHFQGTWIALSAIVGGQDVTDSVKSSKMTFQFAGNRFVTTTVDAKGTERKGQEGTFEVSSQPRYKAITLSIDGKKEKLFGVCLLEGRVLVMCFDIEAHKPVDFDTKGGSPGRRLFIMSREDQRPGKSGGDRRLVVQRACSFPAARADALAAIVHHQPREALLPTRKNFRTALQTTTCIKAGGRLRPDHFSAPPPRMISSHFRWSSIPISVTLPSL